MVVEISLQHLSLLPGSIAASTYQNYEQGTSLQCSQAMGGAITDILFELFRIVSFSIVSTKG